MPHLPCESPAARPYQNFTQRNRRLATDQARLGRLLHTRRAEQSDQGHEQEKSMTAWKVIVAGALALATVAAPPASAGPTTGSFCAARSPSIRRQRRDRGQARLSSRAPLSPPRRGRRCRHRARHHRRADRRGGPALGPWQLRGRRCARAVRTQFPAPSSGTPACTRPTRASGGCARTCKKPVEPSDKLGAAQNTTLPGADFFGLRQRFAAAIE